MGMIFITEGHRQDWKKHKYCVCIVDLSRKKYQKSDSSDSKSIQLNICKNGCWIELEVNYGGRIFIVHKSIQRIACEISIKIYYGRTSLNASHCQVGWDQELNREWGLFFRTEGKPGMSSLGMFSPSWVNTAPYFLKIEVYHGSVSVISSHQLSSFPLPSAFSLVLLLWLNFWHDCDSHLHHGSCLGPCLPEACLQIHHVRDRSTTEQLIWFSPKNTLGFASTGKADKEQYAITPKKPSTG